MLYWALIFFIVSLVSGAMGLYNLAGVTMDIAQFLFWAFLILAALFLAIGLWSARKISKMVR
jgi:uncharacterized membrane protein YtjA (UPF0391 family)